MADSKLAVTSTKLSPTQKFIILVFGLMVAASAMSVFALLALNASQVPKAANTPNTICVHKTSGASQAYLDSDYLGCTTKGMTEAGAVEYLKLKGINARIAKRDGESFILTTDYSESRVNLTVENNLVTDYTVG